MQDRRQQQRWPSYLGASINFNRRSSIAACIVKNFSSAGVKFRLHDSIMVPDEFDFVVPCKRAECRMRLRWRQHEFAGAEFLYSYSSEQEQLLVQARHLSRLKIENAELRRRLGLEID